jgi:hypothetical protein
MVAGVAKPRVFNADPDARRAVGHVLTACVPQYSSVKAIIAPTKYTMISERM